MPRLLDSVALTLALSACSPLGPKAGFAGRHATTPDQFQLTVTAVPSAVPAPAIPDGFECKSVQNTISEKVTRCCLTITPYKACREMESGKAEYFTEVNTVDVGGSKVPKYTEFKEGIPPAAYMNYLVHAAKNATDLAAIVSAFITYQTIQDDDLLPAEEIISQGAGDCDNVANLFVNLLGNLGKKLGHDYKAKILGLDGADHAVAIFLDTDGRWKALDLSLPFNEMRLSEGRPDLYSASLAFERKKGKNDKFFERRKLGAAAGKGARIDQFIDHETMMPHGREIALAVDFEYSPDINPDTFLKDYNWRQVELMHIHYKNDTTAYYQKGVFYQLTETSKVTFYNENRIVTEIQYANHPTIKYEFFTATGQLERRDLKNGKSEVYSNGVLYQNIYATGPIDYEVFYASGVIMQKHYKDGKSEFFDENGKMTHRKDKRGKIKVF